MSELQNQKGLFLCQICFLRRNVDVLQNVVYCGNEAKIDKIFKFF